VLYESLNFASLHKLSVLFVCENNLYSTHMPLRECRPDDNISRVAEAFCIPSYRIDGQDVLAVFETGKNAVEFCRGGNGPVFLECLTYRYRGHVGPDDNIQGCHTDIRPQAEIQAWLARDPIMGLENALIDAGMTSREHLEAIKSEVRSLVREAHERAKSSPYPDPDAIERYVFAAPGA
jgi:pyruvate dehydrogenase E1 component alpha subunit